MNNDPFNGGIDIDAFTDSTIAHFSNLPMQPFSATMPEGPGVYAIYRTFGRGLYGPYTDTGVPLYVGQVAASGARRPGARSRGTLSQRINAHRGSLEAGHLAPWHFALRVLEVEPLLISAVERILIHRYCPPWQTVVDGFSLNCPGQGRIAGQIRSQWDTLHPGRTWASAMKPRDETQHQIRKRIEAAIDDLKRNQHADAA